MAGWKIVPIPEDPGVDVGGIVQFLASKVGAATSRNSEAAPTEGAFEQGARRLIADHKRAKSQEKARTGPLALRL